MALILLGTFRINGQTRFHTNNLLRVLGHWDTRLVLTTDLSSLLVEAALNDPTCFLSTILGYHVLLLHAEKFGHLVKKAMLINFNPVVEIA